MSDFNPPPPQIDMVGLLMQLLGSGGIGTTDKYGEQELYDVDVANKEGTLFGKQNNLLGSNLFGGLPGASDPRTFEDIVTYENVEGFQVDPMARYLVPGSEGSIEGVIARLAKEGMGPSQIMTTLRDPGDGVPLFDVANESEVNRILSKVDAMHTASADYDDWVQSVPASDRDEFGNPMAQREVREKSPIAQQYADAGLANPFEQWEDDDLANVSGSEGAYNDLRAQLDAYNASVASIDERVRQAERGQQFSNRKTAADYGNEFKDQINADPLRADDYKDPTAAGSWWENADPATIGLETGDKDGRSAFEKVFSKPLHGHFGTVGESSRSGVPSIFTGDKAPEADAPVVMGQEDGVPRPVYGAADFVQRDAAGNPVSRGGRQVNGRLKGNDPTDFTAILADLQKERDELGDGVQLRRDYNSALRGRRDERIKADGSRRRHAEVGLTPHTASLWTQLRAMRGGR